MHLVLRQYLIGCLELRHVRSCQNKSVYLHSVQTGRISFRYLLMMYKIDPQRTWHSYLCYRFDNDHSCLRALNDSDDAINTIRDEQRSDKQL